LYVLHRLRRACERFHVCNWWGFRSPGVLIEITLSGLFGVECA
jgi:hypothetical protein